jgi:putative ABC transport system permease protein
MGRGLAGQIPAWLAEALRLAVQSIWQARLRSFFTLLGIIVSVGFLVTVVAVIQGMNAYVKENITGAAGGIGRVTGRKRHFFHRFNNGCRIEGLNVNMLDGLF